MNYPLVLAGSDIAIVPSSAINKFCYYCGIFAAANLFTEMAIPTAMILSLDEIKVINDLDYKAAYLPHGNDDMGIIAKYKNNPRGIMKNWPKNYLYVHPIKLSCWQGISPIRNQAERSDLNYNISKYITKVL